MQIKASGLCHSDVSVQTGALPFPLPMILGHEGAGVVTPVGSDVTTCAVGDHVVLSALIHCGMCDHCVKGRPNLCLWGLQTIFGGRNPDGGLRASDAEGRELFQFSSIGTLAEELIVPREARRADPRRRLFRGGVPHRSACSPGCRR